MNDKISTKEQQDPTFTSVLYGDVTTEDLVEDHEFWDIFRLREISNEITDSLYRLDLRIKRANDDREDQVAKSSTYAWKMQKAIFNRATLLIQELEKKDKALADKDREENYKRQKELDHSRAMEQLQLKNKIEELRAQNHKVSCEAETVQKKAFTQSRAYKCGLMLEYLRTELEGLLPTERVESLFKTAEYHADAYKETV